MIHLAGRRLHPRQVRAATFGRRWRGLDPTQVYDYLALVADELDRLRRALAVADEEGVRIRRALRQWQSAHAGCHRAGREAG